MYWLYRIDDETFDVVTEALGLDRDSFLGGCATQAAFKVFSAHEIITDRNGIQCAA